jgi:hypothetical protein
MKMLTQIQQVLKEFFSKLSFFMISSIGNQEYKNIFFSPYFHI